MSTRVILVALFVSATGAKADGNRDDLSALQSSLDSALTDDAPISLSLGDDFTGPAGTVIFLSREEGAKRMIALARAGEDELAVMYLPEFGAWIIATMVRKSDEVSLDSRYAVAAIALKTDVELWHTHNDIGPELLSEALSERRSIGWAMPSKEDMINIYSFESLTDDAKVTGAIAGIYGVTRFWTDDSLWEIEPIHVGYKLMGEAYTMYYKVGEITLVQLCGFARQYRGLIRLEFEPMSDNICQAETRS